MWTLDLDLDGGDRLGGVSRRNSAPAGGPPWPVANFSPGLVNYALRSTKNGTEGMGTKRGLKRTHLGLLLGRGELGGAGRRAKAVG